MCCLREFDNAHAIDGSVALRSGIGSEAGSRCYGLAYTSRMPTPVGPVPPDPDDPDLWDWDVDEGDDRPRWQPWRLLVVGVIVLGLILLLLVSVL